MEIKKTALAGTVESSDIQITISKGDHGIQIELDSSVEKLYGNQIRKVITETIESYGIKNANVKAIDKGALDCVIKARVMTAVQRALETSDEPNWEVL
ncbi:citrate lyase acyl carrier protein [Ligilactobacillus cholophilus]|uniref:citrate lyase acyl carrier protein n=1 Tax=Ligilactobacillus cholophilus TaxID=3050131 RepID=UPI0025B012F2|nr:citrate lyase acyl carrier protein [Ligilactobacillus cholophilus]